VPGHEFSGVVAAVGEGVGCLEVGREVFGMNDWYSDGALAEYCTAPFFAVAPRPASLGYIEAASVPISALTAWQGLFCRARLQAGERVLIQGGAGAVGAFAIQLARLHGAHVIATASAKDADFVSSLGAERVIDYESSRFDECVRNVDVVFDTVGGETLERSWRVLSPQGRLVTIASTAEPGDARTREAFFIVEPNQKQLYAVGELLETGRIRPFVGAVVPLGQASEVYKGEVVGKGRGKLVVAVAGAAND
jgi:NADPH:quinone reductase-like Zn-dependent oxidoreductase